MYKVLEYFTDLKDNSYEYNVGDTYPRAGYEPSAERIEELASTKNVRHRPLIEPINDEAESVAAEAEVSAEETEDAEPEVEEESEEDFNEPEDVEEKPKKRTKKN